MNLEARHRSRHCGRLRSPFWSLQLGPCRGAGRGILQWRAGVSVEISYHSRDGIFLLFDGPALRLDSFCKVSGC
jgi:hypothetical protein